MPCVSRRRGTHGPAACSRGSAEGMFEELSTAYAWIAEGESRATLLQFEIREKANSVVRRGRGNAQGAGAPRWLGNGSRPFAALPGGAPVRQKSARAGVPSPTADFGRLDRGPLAIRPGRDYRGPECDHRISHESAAEALSHSGWKAQIGAQLAPDQCGQGLALLWQIRSL